MNGVKAHGGSIDVGGPAVADGILLTTSGYPQWGGMRATSCWPSRSTASSNLHRKELTLMIPTSTCTQTIGALCSAISGAPSPLTPEELKKLSGTDPTDALVSAVKRFL